MAKDQAFHYVVVFDGYPDGFWGGYNTIVDQIRKAKLYNSEKMAHQSAKDAIKRLNYYVKETSPQYIRKYKLLKVELVQTDESDWFE